MKDLKKLLLVMVVFAFVGAGALSAFLWFNRDKIFPSELDSNLILQNIFKNNPQSLLSSSLNKYSGGRNALALESADGDMALGMPAPEYLQDVKMYNYNYTKTTSVPGPKASACAALYIPEKKETYENYDYFDENYYYYKSISRNSANDISSYYLEKGEESYQYQGGMYAVKLLRNNSYGIMETVGYDIDVSVEESLPLGEGTMEMLLEEDNVTAKETSEADVPSVDSSYFGEEATVEEITEDGVKYYVATWSYETNCNLEFNWKESSSSRSTVTSSVPEVGTSEKLRKIYVKSWSKADDYQIVKQETYVDSVIPANLVSTTTTQTDSRDVVFSQVADKFSFDLSVPVKEIDMRTDYVDPYSDMDGYLNYTSSFIVDNGIKIFSVDSTDFAMTSAYFNSEYGKQDEWYSYIVDRDFYASTAEGQELYDQAVENYWMKPGSTTLGSVDFANSDYSKSLYIAIFEESISDDDIWNNYVYRGDDMKSFARKTTIDGQVFELNGYYWDYENVDYPDTAPSGSSRGSAGSGIDDSIDNEILMDEKSYISAQLYVLISKNGFKYLINYYGSDETSEDAFLPSFVTRDLTNESVRGEFLSEIEQFYAVDRGNPMPVVDYGMSEEIVE